MKFRNFGSTSLNEIKDKLVCLQSRNRSRRLIMRHRVKGRTLGRSHSHRRAMLSQLGLQLVRTRASGHHGPRAKELVLWLKKWSPWPSVEPSTLVAKPSPNSSARTSLPSCLKTSPSATLSVKVVTLRILKMDGHRLGDSAEKVFSLWSTPKLKRP